MISTPLGFWGGTQSFIPTADFPTYCWSFWKRNPNYTGACIRVKKETGGAEYDIGFSSSGYMDVATLKSLIGNDTAYIIKWYEQFSGNSAFDMYPHYLAGSGLGFAPRIIINGVLKTFVNGQAAIDFNSGWAGSICMLNAGSGTTMVTQFNSTIYWTEENANSVEQNLFGNNNENSTFAYRQISSTSGIGVFYDFGIYDNIYANESKESNGYQNTTATAGQLYDIASYKISTIGARIFGSRGVGYNSLGTGFSIGGRWSNPSSYFRGLMNEALIYNGTTHSDSKVKQIQNLLNKAPQLYDPNSITHNLILWYDAGNSSSYPGSGTTLTDLSIEGKNATLNNGVTYSSADGGKFIFDGSNDWINTSGTTEYPFGVRTSDFTVEVWIKLPNQNHNGRIFGNRGSVGGIIFNAGWFDSGGNSSNKKISFGPYGWDNGKASIYGTTNDVVDGGWKHIVCTRNESVVKIYVNAVSQALTALNTTGNSFPIDTFSNSTWRIADNGSGTGGAIVCEASIFRLYKMELTQEQVTRNFNLEKSRYGL